MTRKEERKHEEELWIERHHASREAKEEALEKACNWVLKNIHEYIFKEKGKIYLDTDAFRRDFKYDMENYYDRY